MKFTRHSRRRELTCADIDNSLKAKNIEPLYGFECAEYIPLRHSSGGGKEIYYPDDQEVDLVSLISSPLPKLPCDVTMRAHWLAVDGVQPMIPENIPPVSFREQKNLNVASTLPSEKESVVQAKAVRLDRKRKKEKEEELAVANGDWTKLKPLQSHGLSMEQQIYYRELCDACVGLSDSKRQEATVSLSTDPGLYLLLPHLVNFIVEGIKFSIAQQKLLNLKNLLRMTKSLLDNDTVTLDRFLHELIPSVLSCVINRRICSRPESEDHWGVREMGAKIIASICSKYSNSINNIQARITRKLILSLSTNSCGLAVHYGAVVTLAELGPELIRTCVIPKLKEEGEFIRAIQGTTGNKMSEQIAANKLQAILQKHCAPVLVQVRSPADSLQVYQTEYGHLGTVMFTHVKALRQGRATINSSQRSVKSPTTPTGGGKMKPPPLTIPSTSVTATRIQATKSGATFSLSPQNFAALRVQLAQATSPIGSPTAQSPIATIPVSSLLSAVVNAQLSSNGGTSTTNSSTVASSPVAVSTSSAAVVPSATTTPTSMLSSVNIPEKSPTIAATTSASTGIPTTGTSTGTGTPTTSAT